MSAVRLPAICKVCGTVFPSGFAFNEASANLIDCESGPCPKCGAMGAIPNGLYQVYGGALTILRDWSPAERSELSSALLTAYANQDAPAAEKALETRPDLIEALRKLIVPSTPEASWGMVVALLAALAILSGH